MTKFFFFFIWYVLGQKERTVTPDKDAPGVEAEGDEETIAPWRGIDCILGIIRKKEKQMNKNPHVVCSSGNETH